MNRKLSILLLGMLPLLFLGSCGVNSYLNNFKSAQQAFNRAATLSNQTMADPELAFTHSPTGEYQTARLYSMYAMGESSPNDRKAKHDKTDLAKDGLLLTAYNIRAMSEWKLGMYSEALATARACRLSFENDPSVREQRDYIVMKVMEALVYNDSIQVYIDRMERDQAKKEPSNTEMKYLGLLGTSMDIVKEQRGRLAEDHPIQRYLCITQLSIAKNWKDLVSVLKRQMKLERSPKLSSYRNRWKEERQSINKALQGVLADFAQLLENGKENALYQRWKKVHVNVPNK